MPSSVRPRPMSAPGTWRGKCAAALVAQKATLDLSRGGALRKGESSLQENTIKIAAPHQAEALIHMVGCGSALNPCNATAPLDGIITDKRNPSRQGTSSRAK